MNILYNYNNMVYEIESIKDQIAELELLDGVGAVRFENLPKTGSLGGSVVESVVLLKEKKRGLLDFKLNSLMRRMNKIDNILDSLPVKHVQILKNRYIEHRSEQDVKRLVRLSGREYRTMHNNAITWFDRSYAAGFGLSIDEDELEHEQLLQCEMERLQKG